ncbi:hypothetical protein PYCCODRAFT_1481818 [Trametes coccinea BRFM310]|uniref:DUF6533 domain-containing protein n=1 Tax=Trametes coccinea (strain BRFM310) TaxID=1353009 RepID=A0A1Y2I9S7_TRAC3|nr:hypothetical protein PYCCODRAFT_1481818 [Trametes coccinea BRFM310]
MSDAGFDASLTASALLENRIALGSIALMAYEYVITLHQEVRFIWMRKKTPATWLFFVIRYYGLLSLLVLQAISFAPFSDTGCTRYVTAEAAFQYAQYIFWAVFSALRALALSNMNWPLGGIVFLLSCGPFAVNIWVLGGLGVYGFNVPKVGCVGSSDETIHEAIIGVAVSRSCNIASDFLVILVTWRSAAKGQWLHAVNGHRPSLMRVMMLNGTIYFLALLIVNSLHLILTLLSIDAGVDPASSVTLFSDPLTAILICRFLLDLHAANARAAWEDSDDTRLAGVNLSQVGSIRFASLAAHSMAGAVATESEDSTLDTEMEYEKGDPGDVPLKDISPAAEVSHEQSTTT